MVSPEQTTSQLAEELIQPTGTGVEEASHPSTHIPGEAVDGGEKTHVPRSGDVALIEYNVQPCEASKLMLKGCSRQQLAGRAYQEVEMGKFVLLEGD